MSKNKPHESYLSESNRNTRGKVKPHKKTIGITLLQNHIKRTRKRGLNISGIAEQTLLRILGYLET